MTVRNICLVVLLFGAPSAYAGAIFVDLGNADPFAVLAGSTVTNTNTPTVVTGSLGVSPGSAVTMFPPGLVVSGTIHAADATALAAQNALTTAYNFAQNNEACGLDLSGQDLGGKVLTSGVYCFTSSAQLTGTLTLNAQGNPNAIFVFQIGSTLTTASASSVVFTNGGQGDGVFWQVGSSAVLGTGTTFQGNILALTSISLNTGASIGCGRALARNGAVTLDNNNVNNGEVAGCEVATPEPRSATLLGMGLLLGLIAYGWQSRKRVA